MRGKERAGSSASRVDGGELLFSADCMHILLAGIVNLLLISPSTYQHAHAALHSTRKSTLVASTSLRTRFGLRITKKLTSRV